ncbi:MAG: glucose-6-phosphate isomerase family protein [Candidatus Bathyarchaeia archaeon]
MLDLSNSGLNIKLDTETNTLILPPNLETTPDRRLFKEIKPILYEKVNLPEDLTLYLMYRDICKPQHRDQMLQLNLRYDITVIPPRMLGREFVKTLGHYHPLASDNLTYPEIYEVLHGGAHFILQKLEDDITDVILYEAERGDKLIIPPNYGHITINPKKETLVTANFVNRGFKPIYQPIIDKGGAAYFEILEGENPKFIKNTNYMKLPRLRRAKPPSPKKLQLDNEPMYSTFEKNPRAFEFLSFPENFTDKITLPPR